MADTQPSQTQTNNKDDITNNPVNQQSTAINTQQQQQQSTSNMPNDNQDRKPMHVIQNDDKNDVDKKDDTQNNVQKVDDDKTASKQLDANKNDNVNDNITNIDHIDNKKDDKDDDDDKDDPNDKDNKDDPDDKNDDKDDPDDKNDDKDDPDDQNIEEKDEKTAPLIIPQAIAQPVTQAPHDTVLDFVSGLTPFISALENFDGLTSPSPADKNKNNDDNNDVDNNNNNILIEEMVMRPIRELIYKSFSEPSEGECGISYVISQLQNLRLFSSSSCNTDLVVRSIGHFLSMSLPPSWINNMSKWMLNRMQLILLKFFTFKHYCSCYFNSDIKQSRLFVLQCALHRRFPLLISEGCASLARSPVFYGTKQCSLFNDNNYIRSSWELLQTGSSFKIIPLTRLNQTKNHKNNKKIIKKNNKTDNNNKDNNNKDNKTQIISPLTMDLRTLEQEIERDIAKGKLPCVVIASYTDNLQKIKSICDRHGLWLHIEGGSSSLLLAAATTLPKTTRIMMSCADSISCQPFKWFTLSSNINNNKKINKSNNNNNIIKIKNKNNKNVIVTTTTKKESLNFGLNLAGCTSTLTFIREDLRDTPPPSVLYSDSDFVMMFPLWHLLVTRSTKQIKNRVDHSLNLCSFLKKSLLERKNIFISSQLSSLSLPQIVIFQIIPNINIIDLSSFKLDINTFHELLVNRCNNEINQLQIQWKLCDDDDDDDIDDDNDDDDDNDNNNDDINNNDNNNNNNNKSSYTRYYYNNNDDIIDEYSHDNIIPYFKFEPLSYSIPESIKNKYITEFIHKIVVEINILRKCGELRLLFQEYINNDNELEYISVSSIQTIMVGLGGFRFIPIEFRNNLHSECVVILNKCLCAQLNAHTSSKYNNKYNTQMYKLARDNNNNVCIVINPTNMIFEDNCIKLIYKQIFTTYKNMKYPDEVMEKMSIATKLAIDNAKKLVENQVNFDYTPDNLIRKVPIFGSVYNWFLPTDNDGINGINTSTNNQTGVGFQIGIGVTKPNIQIQSKDNNDDDDNDNTDNNNQNDD